MGYREVLKPTPIGPTLSAVHQAVYRRNALRTERLRLEGFLLRIPRRDIQRYRDGFEPMTATWLRDFIKPGMTAVDVGAALGMFSLHLASVVGLVEK